MSLPGGHASARGTGPLRLTQVVVSDAFAGTERYVCDVSLELARRGHDVHVVGGSGTVMPGVLGEDVLWSPGSSTKEALGSLRHGRRDVVHGHLTKGEFAAAAAAPVTGGRRLATRHILAPRGHGRAAQLVGRGVRAGLWAEIAVSRFVADAVEPRSEVVLVNGVATVPDELTTPAELLDLPPTVLLAQRLEDEKKTDVAVRAWHRSGLAARGWRMQVAGRGPAAESLQALATELGVADSIQLLGWVGDVPALMRSATVFLATAPAEPCGLSVLEAMAHGLAVVASDAGGHRETVGAAPGARVYPSDDVQACSDLLVAMADDDAARAAYGRALRDLQRSRFTITAHVDVLEDLYRRATLGQPVPAS